ncbi:MAG: tail fiber domain-containing protein [Muribaculaceae bacterium]|nr:tail fiber domain-containing protein [Muribaculaceae bacterium]
MKKLFFIAAFIGMLAFSFSSSAQFTVHRFGNADLGDETFDPENTWLQPQYLNWLDTVSMLRIYGNYGEYDAGAHMTFGDTYLYTTLNVAIGELGYTDTDRMWLHGKYGTYITAGVEAGDTIMYYDCDRGDIVKFNRDVETSGVFIQSDERFKENIAPVEGVLSSLKGLEAVTYTLKNNNSKLRESNSQVPVFNDKAQRDKDFFDGLYAAREHGSDRYGFLAQNVKEVFPELVHTDKAGYMYVDYIGLIPILVQSINELRAELAEVKGEKEQSESPMMQSPQQSSQIEASLQAAKLYQNAPNPWSSETVIRYTLPQSVAQAMIYIYDMQGKQLKSIPAQGRGESQVTLTARDLTAGMYLYALVADGALVDSKQMILTK